MEAITWIAHVFLCAPDTDARNGQARVGRWHELHATHAERRSGAGDGTLDAGGGTTMLILQRCSTLYRHTTVHVS